MCLLHHLGANLSLFLITITLLTMISSVFGQPIYIGHGSAKSNNDTTNLRTLLGSLSSKAAHNTFYNDTSNNMYGDFLCSGDVAPDMKLKVFAQRIMYEHAELTLMSDVTHYRDGMAQSIGNISGEAYFDLSSWTPPTTLSKGKVILIITVPVSTFLVVAFCFYRFFGRRNKAREGMSQEIFLKDLECQDQDDCRELQYFDLTTLQIATNNFSDANKLGQGGFGPVYKGKLHDGKEIAIKRLSNNSGQGLEEFRTEVKLIVKLQHRNIVRLLGCCIQKDEKLLVYEYMANTSLDAFLFDSTKCKELDWAKRENIVIGIAKGLLYLHEDSRLKIIHRDMKASNVLLDDEMNPKISDFGTARISYVNQIEARTNKIVGTYGYMAPEYAMEGIFSVKSDVYSFGVLMLEIISGRRNSASFNLPAPAQGFLQSAWRLWNDGKAQELIDRNLISSCPVRKVAIWINIALLCVQENPNDRPSMSKVALMLGGQSIEIAKPSEPPFSVGRYPMSNQCSSTREGTKPASVSLTLPRE